MEHLNESEVLRWAQEIMERHGVYVPELGELIVKLRKEREESGICLYCNGSGQLEKWDYTGTRMTGHYTCFKCKGTGKKDNEG